MAFEPRKDARRTKPEIVHSLTTHVTLKKTDF